MWQNKETSPSSGDGVELRVVEQKLEAEIGTRSYFTPEGKVALMFLKMYTWLSCPKLLWEGIEKSYVIMCEFSSRFTRSLLSASVPAPSALKQSTRLTSLSRVSIPLPCSRLLTPQSSSAATAVTVFLYRTMWMRMSPPR